MAQTTITDNGDGTSTLTITKTGPTAKVNTLAEEASRYYYPINWQLYDVDEEPIPWDSLTNVQKRYVLGYQAIKHLKDGAHSYYVIDAVETTKDGLDDADTRYGT